MGFQKNQVRVITESKSIPFLTFQDDIIATKLLNLRQELKQVYPKISLLPFMVKACSIAMTDYPLINSVVDNEVDADGFIQRYIVKKAHNFSVAIDSLDGLRVPNIKDVQAKSIL